jgi:hypothetical protein
MSGYTDDVLGRHGVLEDGLYYLAKPFRPAALAAKVLDVLSSRQIPNDYAASGV